MRRVLALLLLAAPAAQAQDAGNPPAAAPAQVVDQKHVDEAVRKGARFLKSADSPKADRAPNSDELILLTLISADVTESDDRFQGLLRGVLEAPLERTYKAALLAMALEEIDRVKYQMKIRDCAQFLVDNQCTNGQWSYGHGVQAASRNVATDSGGGGGSGDPKGVLEFRGEAPFPLRTKPKVRSKQYIKKWKDGPAEGDNSNSQYAALGLRACHDAGVIVPPSVVQLAKKWWTNSRHGDKEKQEAVATGPGASGPPRGWCYKEKDSHPAYASMTAGAVGALCICDYILDRDWKTDRSVQMGLSWMAKNFSVAENVGPCEWSPAPNTHLYYTLYAIERVGMLYGTRKIGDHDWYLEGARFLLDAQKENGAWMGSENSNDVWDTCFAILFLKRATAPLDVASVDAPAPKK